ncbi:hypothetical protein AKJ09_07155 [Labilithrix luteola]|uniref:Type IV fimbrial biogenesis protein PilY1 n=1 Tax=Labilithrix luteola TaxID=1391654 RepID=A0A0K1Q4A9_9BACT|nr:hypothetical protein [Labilithrix luteola]AKV00492.1 hypothetical protein AKJ09_07155 [Labilithrix luteola]
MRRRLWMIFAAGVAARAVVACVADGSTPPPPVADGGLAESTPLVPPPTSDAGDAGDVNDGSTPDADANVDVAWCSDAGWCTTRVPDPSIRFYALVPLERRAFALAWIAGRTTPLVFDGNQWNVIAGKPWDDSTKDEQMLYALAAPNDHEMWLGGTNGYFAHAIETNGSWSFTKIDLLTNDTVQSIFAVDATELFVATETRIYHHGGDAGDAGAPDAGDADAGDAGDSVDGWVVEYRSPNIDAELKILRPDATPVPVRFSTLIGNSASDIWLFGRRAICSHIARRTSAGWATLVDTLAARETPGAPDSQVACFARRGYVRTSPLTMPSMAGPGAFVAFSDTTAVMEGSMLPTRISVVQRGYLPSGTESLWQVPDGPTRYASGYATLMSNPDMVDGGTWAYSTISADGKTPTLRRFTTISGTSEKNMWVAGESYALHRTLP